MAAVRDDGGGTVVATALDGSMAARAAENLSAARVELAVARLHARRCGRWPRDLRRRRSTRSSGASQ
ncbi:MAG: hypothetical protein BGO98_15095 [Myxococcales bacterium 68-20]|nr:MAG: hypothetical protein BGO98_15095 [Myxococcales bacterium 68-20]